MNLTLQQSGPPRDHSDTTTSTTLPREPMRLYGRKVVESYDPNDWPYPREPDCEKECDEA